MKKICSIIAALILSAVVMLCCNVHAYADMGPKPSIELHLTNPPDGEYYVDILCRYNCGDCTFDEKYCAEKGLNYDMVSILQNYEKDGLRPRFGGFNGTDNIINTPAEKYDFTYDVPSRFCIIVVTEDLRTVVSPEIEPYSYNSVISFDVAKMGTENENYAVRENMVGTIRRTIIVFLITLGFTLLIERFVFACYKIDLDPDRNMFAFVIVNLATQIMLYIALFIAFEHGMGFFKMMMILEILIVITEVLLMRRLMKVVDKAKLGKAAVTANIVSALLSLPLWGIISFARLLH